MKKLLIKLLRLALSKLEADGQPRPGLTPRACCPAGPSNLIAAVDRATREARRLTDEYQEAGFDYLAGYQRGIADALVEIRKWLTGKPEEAPADNNPILPQTGR